MRRLLQIPLLIFALLLLGALGLHLLTEMSLFDSFYHAVILLSHLCHWHEFSALTAGAEGTGGLRFSCQV